MQNKIELDAAVNVEVEFCVILTAIKAYSSSPAYKELITEIFGCAAG